MCSYSYMTNKKNLEYTTIQLNCHAMTNNSNCLLFKKAVTVVFIRNVYKASDINISPLNFKISPPLH